MASPTKATHHQVQKSRRAALIEEWRGHQKSVVGLADVRMEQTAPGVRRGVYTGMDGDRPTRTMDALAHELDPGAVTSVNRHSWDVMVLCVAGWGWAEIDTGSASPGAPATACTCRSGRGTGSATLATGPAAT